MTPLHGLPARARSLAAVVALGGCSSAGSESAEERVVIVPARGALRPEAVGCWELVDARGRAVSRRIAWAPDFVRLDSTQRPARTAFPPSRVARRFDRAWRPLPLGFEPGIDGAVTWRADSLTDSIRVAFNNGFFGSVFVLAVRDGRRADTLRGRAYEFSDEVPDRSPDHGAVAAVRVRCGAP